MDEQTALKLAKKWAREGNYAPALEGAVGWADSANRFLRAIDAAQSCERITGPPRSEGAMDERAYQLIFDRMLDVYGLPDDEGVFFLDESNKRVLFSMSRRSA